MKSNTEEEIQIENRLRDFAWLLNDLVVDLKTPADIWTSLSSKANTTAQFMSIARLFVSVAIINLCKLDEAINFYGREIRNFPDEFQKSLREIKKFIEQRKIYAYRSKYLAHAFSSGEYKKRPLLIQDAEPALKEIISFGHESYSRNLDDFASFIYKKDDMNSVVNLLHEIIKYIDIKVNGLGNRE
jgi:hypothetical protein